VFFINHRIHTVCKCRSAQISSKTLKDIEDKNEPEQRVVQTNTQPLNTSKTREEKTFYRLVYEEGLHFSHFEEEDE